MSKLKSKLARRIMAIVLSGAMVMSNMSAYAAELSTERETEVVTEVEDTAAAESTADTADEEAAKDSDDENVEKESPAAESSESDADEAKTEDATEAKTEDADETDTDVEESTAAETEEESADDKETEEETTEEETTEEETTEEETIEEEEDNKEGEITDKTTDELSVDLSEGLVVDALYGNKEILTFTVLADMPLNPTPATVNGESYIGFAQGTTESGNASPNKGSIPTSGSAFKFTAIKDVKLSFVLKTAEKTYHFLRDDGTEHSTADTIPNTLDFTLKAGGTYYFYADGSKPALYAISYKETTISGEPVESASHVFESKNLTSLSASEDGERIPLTDDGYFVLVARSGKPALYTTEKDDEFDDGYLTKQQMKFGGAWTSKGNWIEFTTDGSAKIKVWWESGGVGRAVALYDSSMNELYQEDASTKSGAPTITSFPVSEGGTYRIASSMEVGAAADIRISKIEVTDITGSGPVTTTFDGAEIYKGHTDAEMAAGTWEDGEAVSYVNDYFTVLYGSKTKVEAKSYTSSGYWDDGYTGGYRLNFGATATTEMYSIKFTTTQDEATVSLWWKAGDAGRQVQILDAEGNQVDISKIETTKDTSYTTKFKLTKAGTYYVGNAVGNNYLFKLAVTEGHVEEPIDWSEVPAPVILSAEQAKDTNGNLTSRIDVKVQVVIDEFNGCEKVNVEMYNSDDELVDTMSSAKETDTDTTVSFDVTESGTYSFVAKAYRASEGDDNTKNSEKFTMAEPFVLPLTTPSITRATNDGKGGIEIAYTEVPEAEKYIATAVQVTQNKNGTYSEVRDAVPVEVESTQLTATLSGLTAGEYYKFNVYAVRGEENGGVSESFYKNVKDTAEQVWDYAAFGESTSTNTEQNGYSGDANDGEVSVWSLAGKGKIVPASTDGVSFYYTKVPKDKNFVLEATVVVDEWTYSNGQDGFGLMVSDTVGPHGHSTKFWNNSYMAVATKMEYYWNGSTVLSTDVGAGDDRVRYNMYLGLGSIARTGVTDEWEEESAAGATIPSKFVSQQLSLEHAAGSQGLATGDYNIIGNGTLYKSGCLNVSPLLTEMKLRIEKNNTGYFITYIDANGEETTHKYTDSAIYTEDYANQTLLQIDKEYMYAGFFAARNAKATFKDIVFTTTNVADDPEPEAPTVTYNAPTYSIVSATVSNSPEYDIEFNTNWNGTLSVKDSAGNELVDEDYFVYLSNTMTTVLNGGSYDEISMLDKFFEYECEKDEEGNDKLDENGKKIRISGTEKLKADVKVIVPVNGDVNTASMLSPGANTFTVTFTPDREWHKNNDELQLLSSYAASVQTLTVSYRQYGQEGDNIYVSPDGKSTNDGSKEAPLDIFTAVKYAQAGQTIVLLEGTYSLKKALVIDRGIDGTAENPIRMIAEPGTYDRTNPFEPSRVVIDFNGIASGMTIAGNYWYFRGFDVIKSSDGNKGLQVSGSHNVLDQVNTYYNGNTGIQLSRYKGTDIDKSDGWPADNLILNCTSYLNRDSGEEDADGFAAKLTIGDGNVFDGCIAAYNADDGWDFFAKSETGPIGQVVIRNSVTFKNGYKLVDANGDLDVHGTEIAGRGNGNGFKMGGESIKGYHMLVNSYSFYNKAKGIDANSCPDIQAYNSISFNNDSYNVAFYTGVAAYTEFRALNVISFRTDDETPDAGAEEDQLKPVVDSRGDLNDYTGTSNFYWNNSTGKSENADKQTIDASSFKSLEYKGLETVSRNADGTINMGDFLALTDAAKADLPFVQTAEGTNWNGFKIYEAVEGGTAEGPGVGGQPSDDSKAEVDSDKDTEGEIIGSDGGSSDSDDTWTDEELAQLDTLGDTLKVLLNFGLDEGVAYYDGDGDYYVTYTGSAIKPSVRIAYGITELDPKNYTVSYKNNTNAYELKPGDPGFNEKLAPVVIIKGKSNYIGEYRLYFRIMKADLDSDARIVAPDITAVATGKSQKITPVVTFNGKKLTKKDYAVNRTYTEKEELDEDGQPTGQTVQQSYSGSFESQGTYYMELKAVDGGNYTGTKVVKVSVLSNTGLKPMSKVSVSKIANQIYDGIAHYPVVTAKGLVGPTKIESDGSYEDGNYDYEVAYYNTKDVGVASVVLTGNPARGYYGTKTVTFKTVAKPFNLKDYDVTVKHVTNGKATTYTKDMNLVVQSTGSAVTFGNITVAVSGSQKKLTEGIDYTVSYQKNNKAGTASLVIKGKGNYSGSMTRKFKIEACDISALSSSDLSVIYNPTVAYAKGGAKPTVILKIKGVTVSADNYTIKYSNNQKTGPATFSITGKNLLRGSKKDYAFTVVPKALSAVDMAADNVYYGTAKRPGDGIAYTTNLTVKDSNKRLSLKKDYTVAYYEAPEDSTASFDYNTGKLTFKTTDEEGNPKETTPQALGRTIAYNYESNKTIYAVISPGNNGFYSGYAYTSYEVVCRNDVKNAKIAKLTDIYTYNDGNVAAPRLDVTIQNRILSGGKYVKSKEWSSLTLNEDYEIASLKNNDKAGTCTITIRGIGIYTGTKKATFKIAKKDLTAWETYIANAAVSKIQIDVDEADILDGGKYSIEDNRTFTFDDVSYGIGLTAGTVYGDEDILTFTVLEDMSAFTSEKTVTAIDYIAAVKGSTDAVLENGIPKSGAAFKIDTALDSKITFVTDHSDKGYHLIQVDVAEDGTETVVADAEVTATNISSAGKVDFDLEGDSRYYFYLEDGTTKVYDISYVNREEEVDLTEGLSESETYGNEHVLTIDVLEDMQAATTEDGQTYVQGTTNPSRYGEELTAGNVIPDEGAVYKLEALADTTVTFATEPGETAACLVTAQVKDGMETYKSTEELSLSSGTVELSLTKGDVCYLYAVGSVLKAYGISYTTSEGHSESVALTTTEESPLAKAASGKIRTVNADIELVYGTDYTVTGYSNNEIVVEDLEFTDGYAEQTATVTIEGTGDFKGSRTIQFTIRVKKAGAETPDEDASDEETPSEETSSEETSVEETSSEETSVEETV